MRFRARLRALAAATAIVAALAATTSGPAGAVTNGSLDGNAHPYVGLMTAHAANGNYMWRCSGTLLSPTIFLTAGHCTEGVAYAVVYFTGDLIVPDPAFSIETRSCAGVTGYPCGGPNSYVGSSVNTHPSYNPDAFYLFDLGVVVLDGAGFAAGSYGALPSLNQLDSLKVGRSTKFTSVGFGLQKAFPDAAAWKDVAERQRMVAHPWLFQVNTGFTGDFSLLLSNNAKSGGTCYGDSGGPNFIGTSNVIAGVTSFGMNPTCGGTGGVYRVDRADDLDWLATFV